MRSLLRSAMAVAVAMSFSMASFATHGDHHDGDDIVDVAVKAGSFKTLAAALGAAGLVETLKGDGPFTVFAPTDEAFAKLPAGTVENLLKPENKDQLVAILTFHVVAGKVMSSDLLKTASAKTVNGESASFGLRVGDANVIQADIVASNGVIHVIDTVLIP
ncbi:MAG: fasciclin domain-containing protein [Rhodothermales bacterium]|nr:fasciclin domain-containing protein [Rhodothermales bacterium]